MSQRKGYKWLLNVKFGQLKNDSRIAEDFLFVSVISGNYGNCDGRCVKSESRIIKSIEVIRCEFFRNFIGVVKLWYRYIFLFLFS